MAEWAPPLPPPPRPPSPPPLATYVVQVPKDQIYRVPPPENARIVEEHRKNLAASRGRRPPCLTFLYRLLLIILLIGVILSVLALVIYIVAKPRTPTFAVDHLLARSGAGRRRKPEFDITMKTSNPSGHLRYTFVSGGTATLSRRGSGVVAATGDTPEIDVAGQDEAVFKLVLHSTKSALPSDLEKSLKGTSKAAAAFTLSASFPVRLKVVGVTVKSTSLDVACDIRASGTRVVSQVCSSILR